MAEYRMPAEWSAHEGCLMAWPTRPDLWGSVLPAVKEEYADVARAIAAFEPVTMVAPPGHAEDARAHCGDTVTVIELPLDDSWFRDSAPLFVLDAEGNRAGVDFRFNAWGGKHHPWDSDDRVSALLLEHVGTPRIPSDMILEGGAITVDGEGTLITTEQCLLHPNRNPGMSREEIEAELKARLGVTKVIWLPYGGLLDTETDGHVDGVAAFAAPGTVVISLPEDPAHPDHARMRANRAVLEAVTDARGRRLELVEVPQTAFADLAGGEIEVSYLNYYVANGGVVVPVAGLPQDEEALAVIASAYPGRKVVGVRALAIAFGGGGVHCITQQVPAARTTTG
ncbi:MULTISPECIES: agmatine deiminase family protein [Streptomyces]|uniref:agmatine deiminase family protein n=1 Tax=Streptomyces TaxID=1883 RepID=UPI000F793EFE|nr:MULTISPECIES: agmatine deiminase family protein [Streptomyces]RST07766.1 agmatine deiminase family protein [Streptomyces sp. WAC07149]GLX17342.1 putative agmatine deiminase [Streptomyces lavendulae subsp. lavendulae]GLX24799.1 putative agmatine deiminase [Streptomyces lavendulae subsp. lavendulae]